MSPMVSFPLSTEHALLGFLHQKPMHGYEIHRRLSETEGLGLVWQLKQNRLYALLARLEREGHVTTQLEPQQSRPPRKVYHLTDAGREAFLDWVQSPVEHGRNLRLDFMAKLYFAQKEGASVAQALVEQQRSECVSWLDSERARAEALKDERPYDWLVRRFRVGQLEAMLNWLDTCRQIL